MSAWADGYVVDQDYLNKFNRVLEPGMLDIACLQRGVAPPDHDSESFCYLDLGCGMGLTALCIAAANPKAEIHGTDFMPGHIAWARALARDCGVENAHFHELSFAETADAGLPQMDYIVAHGIFSWVTAARRAEAIAAVGRLLKPGGIFSCGYNALPGRAAVEPLRRAMREAAVATQGTALEKARAARDFAVRLKQAEVGTFIVTPVIERMLDNVLKQQLSHLPHEYLNESWNCFYASDIMAELAEIKLDFAGEADLLRNNPGYLLSEAHQALVAEQPTLALRETVKDFCVNNTFRSDVFVRGRRALSETERLRRLFQRPVALRMPAESISYTISAPGLEFDTDQPATRAVVERLSDGPATIGELAEAVGAEAAWSATEALLISEEVSPLMRVSGQGAEVLNAEMRRRVMSNRDVGVLVSPLGTAFPVDTSQAMFYGHCCDDPEPRVLAARIASELSAEGRSVVSDGHPLEGDEAIDHLVPRAERFLAGPARVLKSAGVSLAGWQGGGVGA